jgi:hypothetical protein
MDFNMDFNMEFYVDFNVEYLPRRRRRRRKRRKRRRTLAVAYRLFRPGRRYVPTYASAANLNKNPPI